MVDPVTIGAAITAATAGVALFDKIWDQMERFITESPEPDVPTEHRMRIQESEGAIVASFHGTEYKRITADDLANLPEQQLRHVNVMERSMENHYAVWENVYPQLALIDSPIQKAKVEQQLNAVIGDVGRDLDGILGFLETCGLDLDDHYMHARDLTGRY